MRCMNGGLYLPPTDECICVDGWLGPSCSVPNRQINYDKDISQYCECANGGECRSDGTCRCKPGWSGAKCTEVCPKGYFGEQCINPCECDNDNYSCDNIKGCVCRSWMVGDNCDIPISLVLIAGGVVALVFVVIITGLIVCYRLRTSNTRTKDASKSVTSDHNHFCKPVYLCVPEDVKEEHNLLINNIIRRNFETNILPKPMYMNLVRNMEQDDVMRLTKNTYSDEPRNLRNKCGDIIYSNIYCDPEKLGNDYDVVQYNDIELGYDHLNHSNPANTLVNHYQIPNGQKVHSEMMKTRTMKPKNFVKR